MTIGLGGQTDSILTPADFEVINGFCTTCSAFFMKSNKPRLTFEMSARNGPGSVNGDPMAVAMVIDPTIGLEYKAIYARIKRHPYARSCSIRREPLQHDADAAHQRQFVHQGVERKFKQLLFGMLKEARCATLPPPNRFD